MIVRTILLVVGIALGGAAVAHAEPVVPSADQPANGVPAPGFPQSPLLTPEFSPVQVPAPKVDDGTITAYPFLSPWVHNVVPVDPAASVELRGAARVTLPGLVVNPNGHCVFDGRDYTGATATTAALRPIVVDTPVLAVTIEPTVRHN